MNSWKAVGLRLDRLLWKEVNEVKTHLSSLLQEVSEGETIVISRGRKPLAKLVPYDLPVVRPMVGEMLNEASSVSEEALQPMGKDELRSWGL